MTTKSASNSVLEGLGGMLEDLEGFYKDVQPS